MATVRVVGSCGNVVGGTMKKTIFDIMPLSEWRKEWRSIRSRLRQNLAPDTERLMLEGVLLRRQLEIATKRIEQLEYSLGSAMVERVAKGKATQFEVLEVKRTTDKETIE